ncbi:hypothetical protein BKA70DRAFT_1239171 [Coprinopsis sp. MPI-PUGE-AT-0042]|nr:hypothetical protein BKA70DRAFT_1239171 [Coprinopsis sp. MPI-PUGE-AT-0042]
MDPIASSSHSSKGKERYALLDGRLVKVVLLSDIDGLYLRLVCLGVSSINPTILPNCADDVNPLRPDEIDWQAWDTITSSEIGDEDKITSNFSRLGLSSTPGPSESPWANLLLDPFVAAEERALRLGPSPTTGSKKKRKAYAAYVVYNGRRMGVFVTWYDFRLSGIGYTCWVFRIEDFAALGAKPSAYIRVEATTMQVNSFSNSSFQGYDTIEEAQVIGGMLCPSVDDSAIRLSEAMREGNSSPSHLGTRAARQDSRLSPETPPPAATSKGKAPTRSAFASSSKAPQRSSGKCDPRHMAGSSKIPSMFHRGDGASSSFVHNLPPSRPITNEDKYYVIQIGLQVGVCRGETEARRRLGPSTFAVMHIEATREKAKALFRRLVSNGDVFQPPSICM